MNYQPVTAGNQTNPNAGFQDKYDAEKVREEVDQQYMFFPVWSSGSTNPQNYDGDAAFDGKEHDFDEKKPKSEVILSLSSSAQSRKQDDKTKKEANGNSPFESFTGYRDLSAEFEDCSDNSSNEVNAAVIRSDNGTKFKNNDLNQFCGLKGIKKEFSIPRTPQQNGITERKNRTLIEAARTMLADSLLPIPFWAEAANTACYVQNRVLVTNPRNKTPYELLHGRTPSIGFMRPFGCLVTILNTLDSLGKFKGKVDEGFLVG
nr:retrovirus-related Pol polyprotein from transposon TNT 1-94 [Tanacetum cinerariifolium]